MSGKTLAHRAIRSTLDEYHAAFLANNPRSALGSVFAALAAGNEYVSGTAPWTLAEAPARRSELERCLYALTELLALAAVLLAPALPTKAEAIWRSLGGPGSVHAQRWPGLLHLDVGGWRVKIAPPLFPRAGLTGNVAGATTADQASSAPAPRMRSSQ